MEINRFTIHELREKLESKAITSTQIASEIIDRIESINPRINAYIRINKDDALKTAEECDLQIAEGIKKPLLGIPIAVKDNICVKNWEITCASKILKGFVSPYDATVIKKLKESGAVLVGTTNMDEFAMGSSTEYSSYGPTFNPWDMGRVPGGSSGGSAAAVSAGLAVAAIGSDTGGSIRQPASFCSVVGLKPTYGAVSRYGLIAFASSLDQIGPLTNDVYDSAIMHSVLSGKDELDSTSLPSNLLELEDIKNSGIKDMRIGVPKELFSEGIDKEIKDGISAALQVLAKLGAKVDEISFPSAQYCLETYYLIAPAEASSNLARFDGVKYGIREQSENLVDMYKRTREAGFGPEVKRRIMLGTYALSSGYYDEYYMKARRVRNMISNEINKIFEEYDCLISPTSPTAPFKINEKNSDPLQMYLSDMLTILANITGVPAVSVPAGFTNENLPVGMQIIGQHYDEQSVLKTAYAYEQATEWHKRKPSVDCKIAKLEN